MTWTLSKPDPRERIKEPKLPGMNCTCYATQMFRGNHHRVDRGRLSMCPAFCACGLSTMGRVRRCRYHQVDAPAEYTLQNFLLGDPEPR
jgi:hypothetical protein